MTRLSISLVTFHPDIPMLRDTLASLRVAVDLARQEGTLANVELTLVDNGDDEGLVHLARGEGWLDVRLVCGQGNVGFGGGHNLALDRGIEDLHLILNPDVYLQPESLSLALRFMQTQPECGLLSPAILGGESGWHFLCKRKPNVFDLFLRGFAPRWLQWIFRKRMARYEMKTESQQAVFWDPPIVSGCFMLFRSGVLKQLNGFDPRYFLYFEDFDLSLRAGRVSRVAAVGDVRIAHFGGGAARKGFRHVRLFCRSACVFFQLHGWILP